MAKLTISGLQKAQKANLTLIRSVQPRGVLGSSVKGATIQAHQAAVRKTHHKTGSLKASQRMKVNGLRGVIFIDPSAVNPRTKQKPSEYGLVEHGRGGSHAFYERTLREDGKRIAKAACSEYLRGLR